MCERQQLVGKHLCFKNWGGSSPAIMSDIIVEGFNNSMAMHNLIYKKKSLLTGMMRNKVRYGTKVRILSFTVVSLSDIICFIEF